MDWEVHEDSLRVDPNTIQVVLQGHDRESGGYWEIHVTPRAMHEHCGAKGHKDDELKRAFKEHRDKILNVAWRKYNAGQGERLRNRTLIQLDKEDFDTFREKPVS